MSIWSELEKYPRENKRLIGFWAVVFLVSFLLAGLLVNLFPFADARITFVYMFMMVTPAMVAIAETIAPKNKFFHVNMGWANRKTRLWAGLAGLALSPILILVGGSYLSLSIPTFAFNTSLIYTLLFAWLFEEAFFRQMAFPVLTIGLNTWLKIKWALIPAAVIVSFFFATWHGYVFNLSLVKMGVAFLMSMIYTLGNLLFKDTSFGSMMHFSNNLTLVLLGSLGMSS